MRREQRIGVVDDELKIKSDESSNSQFFLRPLYKTPSLRRSRLRCILSSFRRWWGWRPCRQAADLSSAAMLGSRSSWLFRSWTHKSVRRMPRTGVHGMGLIGVGLVCRVCCYTYFVSCCVEGPRGQILYVMRSRCGTICHLLRCVRNIGIFIIMKSSPR